MDGPATARTLSHLWMVVVAVLAVTVLYLAKVLLLPLGFAILFAFLLAPVVAFLERIRFPRALAALTVILAFAALLSAIAWALFTQFVAIANDLPTYRDNIQQKIRAIHSPSDSAFGRAEHEVQVIADEVSAANTTASTALHAPSDNDNKPIGTTPEKPVQVRDVGKPTGRLDQLGGILEPLTTALLAVVFTFFVLLQREDLRNRMIRLSGDRNLTLLTQAMGDASRRISRYFSLQVAVNVTYGSIIAVALYFIGLPHPLLFGALAAIARFVPYVGAPIAALLPTLLSVAVFRGWSHSIMIAGLFLVMEIVTANYAEPHIYGKHTGLSSLAVLIAAAFWTLIWGPVGLVLSIPLTVCLVVMGSHIPSLEFLTVLLGDQPVIPPYTSFYQRLLAHDEREAAELLESSLHTHPLVAVYDSILLPAFALVESDRQKGELDDHTVRYIRNAASEMVDELGFRALEERSQGTSQSTEPSAPQSLVRGPSVSPSSVANPAAASDSSADPASPQAGSPGTSHTILVLPIRDGSDDLVSTMLAQVLELAGFHATTISVRPIDQTVAAVSDQKPEMVFLSGMPPVAMARGNRIFRALRAAQPELKIITGIWTYADDPTRAAQMISRTEALHVSTSLADAVAQARAAIEPKPSVPEPLDASPQLVTTPKDNAA